MSRAPRIIAVTVGLAVLGALCGGVLGALVFLGMVGGSEGFRIPPLREVLFVGAVVGAPIGAVLAPILGWTLLRQAPIGVAVRAAVLWSAGAALLGWLITPGLAVPFAILGLVWGAWRVSVRTRRHRTSQLEQAI